MAKFQPGQSGNPAGRPRKAERYAGQFRAAEDRIADKLPALLDDLFKLAHGGWWEEEEELKAAGLLTTGSGEFETPIFPDKAPGELVVVGRRRKRAAPDRQALTYLVDRLMGRPGVEGGEAEALLTALLRHVDPSTLSNEQIEQLAAGADPIAVLLGSAPASGPGRGGAAEADE